ncbi:MAG: HAD-IA family hydrolase [Chloroflexi bacterium]|jgi:HAD superfamily hydrolase (TIGR01509 family)|nr:HAD-IA family hydrolase [Chloroflexota bacterium]
MIEIAIVLDMDGLMVDTEPLSRRAWAQVLATYGHDLDDAVYNSIIGYRFDESANMIIETYDLPVKMDTLARQKADILAKIRASGVPVMPGLFDLHAAINQRALPWGVATSSPRHHAQEILQQIGLEDSCQIIVGGDEVSRGKPAPDIYLLAAERLGVPSSRCLALEDSAPGCRSALAAGMMVVAIPNGDTKEADFSAVDHIYPSLHNVADELDALLAELTSR